MNKIVEEIHNKFKDYQAYRNDWAIAAQEDKEFRLGIQWTKKQVAALNARGQAPIVINRVHPAVETLKALLTANRPEFRVSPREDSDNQVAQAINGIVQYIWQESEGDMEMRTVVDDYATMGLGALFAYQDGMADMGKGEVKFRSIDPLDIYIDPNTRHPFGDDAERMMIVRQYTKDQAMKIAPNFKKKIFAASGWGDASRPDTGSSNDSVAFFPETDMVSTFADDKGTEKVDGYHDFKKVIKNRFRIYQTYNGFEDLLEEADFREYLQSPVWIIMGQYIDDEYKAQQLMQQITQQYQQQMAQYEQALQQGQIDPQTNPPPQPPQVEQLTKAELIERDVIDAIETPVWRIQETFVMGDTMLYQRILDIDKYPIILFMNIHTGTPYPLSDVRMVKDKQRFVNKMRSLIVAHASTATNLKVMIPRGSQDLDELEKKWALPGAFIEFEADEGMPIIAQPAPIPNELYKAEQDAKADIDHEFGLYELMMGNSSGAPSTYKATISIDEFGQRRVKSKLMDIEAGLKRLAQVVIPFAQQLYTIEKVIRLVQPNGVTSEYAINKRLYDQYEGQTLKKVNNITTGLYDVVLVSGSTLPSNRYAQLEMYMDAYEKGVIDRQEVLKKTEVFDMEGVLQRTDDMQKLQGQVQQQDEEIKKLRGDLQTREREVYHSMQRLEVEKFKNELNNISTSAKAAEEVYSTRLQDSTKEINKNVSESESEKKKVQAEAKKVKKEASKVKIKK